ncbi:uncharacterized protein LOC110987418 [Acanthaster planci]|uniref:Uncharacterized protein LOC110987418 n=1 Tax=Acanthaster planci TaxID=133434 RepID=A0A8B7ZQW8_ACAPL|nr:uncharacterized protein LOC110987418 [Acanthaster planci]
MRNFKFKLSRSARQKQEQASNSCETTLSGVIPPTQAPCTSQASLASWFQAPSKSAPTLPLKPLSSNNTSATAAASRQSSLALAPPLPKLLASSDPVTSPVQTSKPVASVLPYTPQNSAGKVSRKSSDQHSSSKFFELNDVFTIEDSLPNDLDDLDDFQESPLSDKKKQHSPRIDKVRGWNVKPSPGRRDGKSYECIDLTDSVGKTARQEGKTSCPDYSREQSDEESADEKLINRSRRLSRRHKAALITDDSDEDENKENNEADFNLALHGYSTNTLNFMPATCEFFQESQDRAEIQDPDDLIDIPSPSPPPTEYEYYSDPDDVYPSFTNQDQAATDMEEFSPQTTRSALHPKSSHLEAQLSTAAAEQSTKDAGNQETGGSTARDSKNVSPVDERYYMSHPSMQPLPSKISSGGLQERIDSLKQLMFDVMEQICDNVDSVLIQQERAADWNTSSLYWHSGNESKLNTSKQKPS